MKTCNKCKETKLVEEFRFADKAKKYKRNICKSCSNEKAKKTQKKYRQTDKYKEYAKKHRKKHRKKYNKSEKAKKTRKEWRNSEHGNGLIKAALAKYKAKKLQSTPSWSDLEKIKEIYINCPKNYEVDHIIPLQGKIVSGLHIPDNLQYLTIEENRRKGNRI
jgi:hypothetical protein|tara:strand:- start:38 stop:523 length:486 start_codon:yes stop_codon:yes gene_type:complete